MEDDKTAKSIPGELKEVALRYMKIITDIARESVLLLDNNLRVISANPTFYQNFQIPPEQTENVLFYELGGGQWSTPELRKLLEEILPDKKVVRNYQFTHTFERIGKRTIQLNARQVDSVQLIILAIEDITNKKLLEEKMADYTKELETDVAERTEKIASQMKETESLNKMMFGRELKMVELKKEIEDLKKRGKNGNGKKKE